MKIKQKRIILKFRNFTSICLALILITTAFMFRILANYNGIMKNLTMANSSVDVNNDKIEKNEVNNNEEVCESENMDKNDEKNDLEENTNNYNDINTESKLLLENASSKKENINENFNISLYWIGISNTEYKWNAEKSENRVIKLGFYYQNEITEKAYNPGEITVSIPGIGKLNRENTLKAENIEADEYGVIEKKRDWSYQYDEDIDTYKFYNNKEIQKGASFNGSFELFWEFSSRECVNGYSQILQATLNDGEDLKVTEEISLNFTSMKDTYNIQKTAKIINSCDGLSRFIEDGKEVKDYAWVQYTFTYNTKQLNSRGLKNRYLLDIFPKGCIIAKDSNIIANDDGTISYKFTENSVSDTSYMSSSIIVGYPEEYIGKTIKNEVNILGVYKDEEDEVKLANSDFEVKINKIIEGFNSNGYILESDKNMSPEYIYRENLDRDINFSASLSSITSIKPIEQEEYGVAITDDLLEIYTDSFHKIEDDKYEFTNITVPGKNNFYSHNNYKLEDENYNLKIKVLYRDNVNTRSLSEYTTIYDGKWENENISKTLKDVVAVRVEVNGLKESIESLYFNVQGKININDYIDDNPKYIVNYDFTEFLDKTGNSLIESIFQHNFSRNDLFNQDNNIYGKGQIRSSDSIRIEEKKEEQAVYYAHTEIENFSVDKEIENFETMQRHCIEVNNRNRKEINKIEIYGVNENKDLKTAIETLKFIYSNLNFKYGLSRNTNLDDYVTEKANIFKNNNEIKVIFDFTDNPIISDDFSIGYIVQSNLSYEDYYDEKNSEYRIFTYGFIEDAEVNPQSISNYDGRKMSWNSNSANILLALDSHEQLIKLIKTDFTNEKFVANDINVSINTEYTYRFKLKNGNKTLLNTEFIDVLEQANLTNVEEENLYNLSEWYGKFKNVNTSYLETKGINSKIYYANTINPSEIDWKLMEIYEDGIWKTENDVKAIKVKIEGPIEENSIINIDVNMISPADESKEDKKAYNIFVVNSDILDIYTGIRTTYLSDIPSNSTELKLEKKEYSLEISKADAEKKSGEIKINKMIKSDSIEKAHGNSTFIFKIVGKDANNDKKITLYRAITFYDTDRQSNEEYITKSIIISNLEKLYYEIKEEKIFRYNTVSINKETENVEVNNKKAVIDLTGINTKGEISFVNEKTNNSLLTDSKFLQFTLNSKE